MRAASGPELDAGYRDCATKKSSVLPL